MSDPDRTRPWWRDAVFYQVYVRSFGDASGDGLGDLAGIRARLPYLRDLGVDAVWLTPFYPSPMADGGYDVADPRGVDPVFGDLAGLDRLVEDAHALGLRLTVDIVPNHSSDRHPWFRAALAAAPGSPERARYIFRDGRGPGGQQPPNNWLSVFGGPAWERVPDGQWYLHMFAKEQPDLDWRCPDVVADYDETLRFWLDRGVDGFRIDVAHGLIKDVQLRDNPGSYRAELFGHGPEEVHSWNQPEVHEIYRRWRKLLDSYPGDRMAIGEVWVRHYEDLARYVRPDELHQAFNFRLVRTEWGADAFRSEIAETIDVMGGVGAAPTWVLSNHDIVRHVTRFGGGELGASRARAAILLLLALPGSVYLYQGEELGLPEVTDLPDEVLQDPVWERSGHAQRGRDGCRVPLPWSGDEPPFGFSPPGTRTWLPQPPSWRALTAERQRQGPGSMLSLYREAIGLRRRLPGLREPLRWDEGDPAAPDVVSFVRGEGGDAVRCIVNFGADDCALPPGEVLLASAPPRDGRLPGNAAAWVS
ncbi:MAG: glycoside hydrolase family 13 protein [Frankiaceae bacterium]